MLWLRQILWQLLVISTIALLFRAFQQFPVSEVLRWFQYLTFTAFLWRLAFVPMRNTQSSWDSSSVTFFVATTLHLSTMHNVQSSLLGNCFISFIDATSATLLSTMRNTQSTLHDSFFTSFVDATLQFSTMRNAQSSLLEFVHILRGCNCNASPEHHAQCTILLTGQLFPYPSWLQLQRFT